MLTKSRVHQTHHFNIYYTSLYCLFHHHLLRLSKSQSMYNGLLPWLHSWKLGNHVTSCGVSCTWSSKLFSWSNWSYAATIDCGNDYSVLNMPMSCHVILTKFGFFVTGAIASRRLCIRWYWLPVWKTSLYAGFCGLKPWAPQAPRPIAAAPLIPAILCHTLILFADIDSLTY